jgi:hypothetical protein
MPSETFPVTGPIQSSVHFALGEVTVTTDDSGQATASVEPSDPDDRAATSLAESARISLDGGELRVVLPDRVLWRTAPAALHVRLTVPAGSSVGVAAGVLTLDATGRLDDISLKAGVGTINVEHAATLSVRGGTATVDVGSATSVAVKCGRAELRVGAAEDVYVKTGQGQVEIGSCSGEVTVKGAMVNLDVAAASRGQIRFDAAMGNAQVGVVEGTTVELDLSSATGDARSELAPTGEPAGREAALRVKLRATSGDVVVCRSNVAQASAAS